MGSLLPAHSERDKVQLVAQTARANINVDHQTSLGAEIRSVADTSSGLLYHAYNPRQQLPNEIWCTIWAYLPLQGVITVSHVCGLWRAVAISCPTLWCNLRFWSSRHHEDCECNECSGSDGSVDGQSEGSNNEDEVSDSGSNDVDDVSEEVDEDSDGSDEDSVTGRSNLDEVITLLPRSRLLPLTLNVTISAYRADLDVVGQLAHTLLPHYQRIESIRFYSDGAGVPDAFFPSFDTLPELTCLVVESREDEEAGRHELISVSSRRDECQLLLPSLRRLVLIAGMGTRPLFAESLTVMRLPFLHPERLLEHVLQAPNLQHLMLLQTHRYPRGLDLPDFSALKTEIARRVPRVDVLNIGNPKSFHHGMQLLDTQYRELKFSYTRCLRDYGLDMLATVPSPKWFRLLRREEDVDERLACRLWDTASRLVFSLGDGAHTRTLSLPLSKCHNDPALTAAWDAHPAQLHAPAATVDLALLPRVPPRVAALVRTLIIEMPQPSCPVEPLPAYIPLFPALEEVEFVVEVLLPSAQYPERTLVDVVTLLTHETERKLVKIVVSGALLDRDGSLLSSLTDDLVRVERMP